MPEHIKREINNKQNQDVHVLSHVQLQKLVATSTGFIDAYYIDVYDDVPILLPQNLILSAMTVESGVTQVEWHDLILPTYAMHSPDLEKVTALIIDGETEATRFCLLCDAMPQPLRIRISEVLDITDKTSEFVYQYVKVNEQTYQIPDLWKIEQSLFSL